MNHCTKFGALIRRVTIKTIRNQTISSTCKSSHPRLCSCVKKGSGAPWVQVELQPQTLRYLLTFLLILIFVFYSVCTLWLSEIIIIIYFNKFSEESLKNFEHLLQYTKATEECLTRFLPHFKKICDRKSLKLWNSFRTIINCTLHDVLVIIIINNYKRVYQ